MNEISIQKKASGSRLWLVLFAGGAVLLLLVWPYFLTPHDRIPWRTDFAAAQKEAQAAHKPLFVDLSASWCQPCQYMKTSAWADRTVARAMEAYVPVSIDVDAQPEIAARFYADYLPTFYILDSTSQNVLNGHSGMLEPDEFLQWLRNKPDLDRGRGPSDEPTFPLTTQATANQ